MDGGITHCCEGYEHDPYKYYRILRAFRTFTSTRGIIRANNVFKQTTK